MDEFLTANCFRLGSGKVYTEVDFAVQDVVGNQYLQKAGEGAGLNRRRN